MSLKKVCALYAVLVGVSMIAVWLLYFTTGTIAGIKPDPNIPGISLHIVAEFITAFALLGGGIGLFASKKWGRDLYFLGLGLLIYAVVNSPGYYIKSGGPIILAIFGGTLIIAIVFFTFGLYLKD